MKKDYPDIQALENERWQDPDPATGKLGTRVPAKWLQLVEDSSKSLTLEILEVLKEAKIEPNELKNTQLKDAIISIAAARVINWKDVQSAPKILDLLGDSKIDGASQRIVNVVNTLAKNAQTAANLANDKANQAKQEAYVADQKAVAAQKRADDAHTALTKKLDISKVKTALNTSTTDVPAMKLLNDVRNELLSKEVEVLVDQIFIFDSTVPAGFIERKGQFIDKATMPKLFSRYGANMPDDRDRVHRMAGELAGNAGTIQEDAIRNIIGEITTKTDTSSAGVFKTTDGPHTAQRGTTNWSGAQWKTTFDASRVVPTANENRVKSRIVIFCNKIQ